MNYRVRKSIGIFFTMKLPKSFIVVFSLFCIESVLSGNRMIGGEKNAGVFSLQSITTDQKPFSMESLRKNKASVLLFLSESCPICQKYSPTLRKLYQDFSDENIEFYGVFPSMFIVHDSVVGFAKKFNLPFTMLIDSSQSITSILNAKITPEVFVISGEGEVLYRGRIDNLFPAIGRKRFSATSHELRDTLSAIARETAIQYKETEPVGCFIEFATVQKE